VANLGTVLRTASRNLILLYQQKMEQLRGLQDEVQDEVNEICAQCDEPEYKMDEPLEAEEMEVRAAACQPTTSKPTAKPRLPTTFCRQHNRAEFPHCTYTSMPAHHCQALIAICQECGLHHPVIADACQLQNKA